MNQPLSVGPRPALARSVFPSVIYIHTLNPVGRENMRFALAKHAPEHVTVYVRPALVPA